MRPLHTIPSRAAHSRARSTPIPQEQHERRRKTQPADRAGPNLERTESELSQRHALGDLIFVSGKSASGAVGDKPPQSRLGDTLTVADGVAFACKAAIELLLVLRDELGLLGHVGQVLDVQASSTRTPRSRTMRRCSTAHRMCWSKCLAMPACTRARCSARYRCAAVSRSFCGRSSAYARCEDARRLRAARHGVS